MDIALSIKALFGCNWCSLENNVTNDVWVLDIMNKPLIWSQIKFAGEAPGEIIILHHYALLEVPLA